MSKYEKGDLKKAVAELRKQGVEVIRDGSVYRIFAKIKEFGGLTLKQSSDAFGCYVFVMTGYWDDGCPRWSAGDWDKIQKQFKDIILAE